MMIFFKNTKTRTLVKINLQWGQGGIGCGFGPRGGRRALRGGPQHGRELDLGDGITEYAGHTTSIWNSKKMGRKIRELSRYIKLIEIFPRIENRDSKINIPIINSLHKKKIKLYFFFLLHINRYYYYIISFLWLIFSK